MAQNHVLGEEARECQRFRAIPGKSKTENPTNSREPSLLLFSYFSCLNHVNVVLE